jgi:transposase-like protein
MTTSKKRWSASEARAAIAAWQQSGQSMAAFARQHGFDPQRLGWWRRRLGGSKTPVELVPVVVRSPTRRQSEVRVQLEGCEVEVSELSTASAEWVATLARALREGR